MDIHLPNGDSLSAILRKPRGAKACCVLAHGAGAGMEHPFMADVAQGLAARHVATLRFNFAYMQAGRKAPDRPPVAQAAIRAAVAAATRAAPGLPLFAGGKSFGGRMASLAQAEAPLPGLRGLVFLGFPLHPAGKPSAARAAHLPGIVVPMLFVQGTRDALAEPALLRPVLAALGPSATLIEVADGDHGFHVRESSGRTDAQALDAALDQAAAWMLARAGRQPSTSMPGNQSGAA